MNPPPKEIEFIQGGYFYDMVGTFMSAVAGLESIFHPNNPMEFKLGQVITLEGKVHPELRISPYLIRELWLTGKIAPPTLVGHLVMMLVNFAYESVTDKNDDSPLFEFFRHVRNAGSHNNRFNFRNHESSRPASWRSVVIDDLRKGTRNPLFGTPCFPNFIAPADALLLLWDVEQHLKRLQGRRT